MTRLDGGLQLRTGWRIAQQSLQHIPVHKVLHPSSQLALLAHR